MDEEQQEQGSALDSTRRLGASALGLLHNRLELFRVELQEEKLRALRLLLWVAVGATFALAGLLVAIGTLALLLWRTTGYWGLAGLAVVLLGATAAVFLVIRRRILSGPQPFAATAEEFRKDLQCLDPRE